MAYDLEEQETIDQMKAWWEKWGTPITAAVCVVCLGFAGWNGWQWYKNEQAAKASVAYVQLQNAVFQNDAKNVDSISSGLMTEYGTTVYATLGALLSADAEAKDGQLDAAVTRLKWVVEKSGHPEYDTLARVRLAGLYLTQEKYDAALAELDAAKPLADQQPLVLDRRGDVYLAKGDVKMARECWEKAVQSDLAGQNVKQIIHLKLSALPKQP